MDAPKDHRHFSLPESRGLRMVNHRFGTTVEKWEKRLCVEGLLLRNSRSVLNKKLTHEIS